MQAIHVLFLTIPLSASASAQTQEEPVHGRVAAENVSDAVLPGVPDADDVEVAGPRILVPLDAIPAPMPGPSRPYVGPVRALEYDSETGIEREIELPANVLQLEDWLPGRTIPDQEGDPEAFGSLSSVTSKAYPWSTYCRIAYSQNGVDYVGSGTLIDAQTVMTAAHVVHAGGGGAYSDNVQVFPAYDGDDDAFGGSGQTKMYAFSAWKTSGDRNYDMGFIRLKRPVGYLTGWLGAFYNASSSFWSSTSFRAAGYPGSCFSGAPFRLYTGSGVWDSISTNRVEANLLASCWIGGMSGGGVYYTDGSGNRFCGATLSYAWGYPTQTTRIGCNRMTQTKFDYMLNTFILGGYPSTAKDLVPLKVRTGSTTIQRGHAPTSMTYQVYNNSLYNPGPAGTNVSVYLSKNSTITTSDTRIQTHSFTWNFGVKTGVTINMTPPVIPSGTAPGTYYLGILITSSDANDANNATISWDAQRITVTP